MEIKDELLMRAFDLFGNSDGCSWHDEPVNSDFANAADEWFNDAKDFFDRESLYTKEKPKQSGKYWIRIKDTDVVDIADVKIYCGDIKIDCGDIVFDVDFSKTNDEMDEDEWTIGAKDIEWYGPLIAPK